MIFGRRKKYKPSQTFNLAPPPGIAPPQPNPVREAERAYFSGNDDEAVRILRNAGYTESQIERGIHAWSQERERSRAPLPISGGRGDFDPTRPVLLVRSQPSGVKFKLKVDGREIKVPAGSQADPATPHREATAAGAEVQIEVPKNHRDKNKFYKFKGWVILTRERRYDESDAAKYDLVMDQNYTAYAVYEETTAEAEFLEPQLRYKDFGSARRGRAPWQLGGKSKLAGGYERRSLAYQAGERRGQENLPRVTMAVNKGKYELNNIARLYAGGLYDEYKKKLEEANKKFKDTRDEYYNVWRSLAGFTKKQTRLWKYTIRRGFKMPMGMGGSNTVLEDILEKEEKTDERRRLRLAFEAFSNAEAELNKLQTTELRDLEENIRKRLEPAAKSVAAKYIYKYKIGPDFEDARKYIESQLEGEAAALAGAYARTGRVRLRGIVGIGTRLSMKSGTLRNIWYTMLYNIWDFVWGPMFFGLIMAIFVMGGFISMFILPTYNLTPALFLYILPLAGAAINWVMNFESNKYAMDHMDSMVSGALIAQGITIFMFALLGEPGRWLGTGWYYGLFAFLFIFFGIFQFYQTGGFPVVVKMAVIVLIFGWVALGPYKAVYEGAINQVRTPVLVAWRTGSNAVTDIWLLVTNPTAWYAKQQTINMKPEKPISIPRALEMASIDVLPQNVPQGSEFAMVLVIKNEGDIAAQNIRIRDEEGEPKVGCNAYCNAKEGVISQHTFQKPLLPGEAERIDITKLLAIKEHGKEYEFRLGRVFINLSYDYSTNSSLLVTVMSENEFKRRFAEKEDVYRNVLAVSKVGPAQLSLNVGPQPLQAGKKSLLLVSVLNTRDDGRIFLRKYDEKEKTGDIIILRMPKAVGSNLDCGNDIKPKSGDTIEANGRTIKLEFDASKEEVIVFRVPQDQEIRQYEFKTVFSLLCSFDARLPDDKEAQTGLITAELPAYEFRILKEKEIPITAAVGILTLPHEKDCNKCGGKLLDLKLCTQTTCAQSAPAGKKCWYGASAIVAQAVTSNCHACASDLQCSSFQTQYLCNGQGAQCAGCTWNDKNGQCVAGAISPTYCSNLLATERRKCTIGEGGCKDTSECDPNPKESISGVEGIKLECRDPEIGTKLCCPEKSKLGDYADTLCKSKYEKIKSKLVPVTTAGEIPDRIRQLASQMKPAGADAQIQAEGVANSFEELVLKIASWESRDSFKHCRDGTLNCVNDNSYANVLCSSANSCGVMQINLNVHKIPPSGCQNFINLDCNIRTGVQILIDSYNSNKNGRDPAALVGGCKTEPYLTQYRQYSGWKAAIRGYNGWGCGAGADIGYVESVINQRV